MDKNKASEKLRELLYKSNKTIKKNGIKHKFILDDDTILALKIAINNLENSETNKIDKIEFESPKERARELINRMKELLKESDKHTLQTFNLIRTFKEEYAQALDIAIESIEQTQNLDKIEFESPKVNRLEMARVKNHYTLNESGYYIKIRKGTRVILDNATQEIYGITDSITLDILKGIVLEKE